MRFLCVIFSRYFPRLPAPYQTGLALMHHNGQGMPQNYAKAVEWYTRAADQGFARAQANLGVMYAKGEGAPG